MYNCIYIYAQYIIPRPSTFYPWGWPLASPNMETAAWPLVTHCAIRIFCFINISILVESQNVSVNLNYWQSAISNVMICHRMMMDICIYIYLSIYYTPYCNSYHTCDTCDVFIYFLYHSMKPMDWSIYWRSPWDGRFWLWLFLCTTCMNH
jgi:hypothetical protein